MDTHEHRAPQNAGKSLYSVLSLHTPVTGSWQIVTHEEAGDHALHSSPKGSFANNGKSHTNETATTPSSSSSPSQQFWKRHAALKTYAPGLQVVSSPRVRDASGVTIPLTPRQWYTIQSGERHSHFDANTYGSIGCAQAHIRVWRAVAADVAAGRLPADGWTLICESDAVVYRNALETHLATFPPLTFSSLASPAALPCILLLGYIFEYRPSNRNNRPGRHGKLNLSTSSVDATSNDHVVTVPTPNGWVLVSNPFAGLHGYLLRNGAAGAVVNSVLPLDGHVDLVIGSASAVKQLPPIWRSTTQLVRTTPRPSLVQGSASFKVRLPYACGPLVIAPYIAVALLLVTIIVLVAVTTPRRGRPRVPQRKPRNKTL